MNRLGLIFDPVSDEAPRQVPRKVLPFLREVPKTLRRANELRWVRIGPPHRRRGNGEVQLTSLWQAAVPKLSDTFSDVLPLATFIFARTGTGNRGRKKYRVKVADVVKSVEGRYHDRLKLSRKLFGVIRIGASYFVPAEVLEAFNFAASNLYLRVSDGLRYRFASEAAMYAHVYGPAAVQSMRSTFDLEAGDGLKGLLNTWWKV